MASYEETMEFKFLLVDLEVGPGDIQVATVSENWRKGEDEIYYPKVKGWHLERALRDHADPSDFDCYVYKFRVRKICGKFFFLAAGNLVGTYVSFLTDDWKTCRSFEKRALDSESDLRTDKEELEKRVVRPPRRFDQPSAAAIQESVSRPVVKPVSEPASKAVSEPASKVVPKAASKVSEPASKVVSKAASKAVPKAVSKPVVVENVSSSESASDGEIRTTLDDILNELREPGEKCLHCLTFNTTTC